MKLATTMYVNNCVDYLQFLEFYNSRGLTQEQLESRLEILAIEYAQLKGIRVMFASDQPAPYTDRIIFFPPHLESCTTKDGLTFRSEGSN